MLALYRAEIRPARDVDERAVAAVLVAATFGYQLFRPFLKALFPVDAAFDATYRRHLARALETFRPRAERSASVVVSAARSRRRVEPVARAEPHARRRSRES